ncbi:T9SS type A sorting domain-containing protein [Hymenobacter sediminicola]|uniref:T9SS type A sorting domain-containing protein n=1 Tax=Hymenobacter sediminicola TaxID=2761579 RepID=A0A7G7W391_9BACT|nr:T9SS type A sorting domain-containing protein [Hymenobacter sediminicola]QNH60834.1 T9SS type A sorting domain-containing protein [Hymenobacter sediminicola]
MLKNLLSFLICTTAASAMLTPATAQVVTITGGTQISALSPINHASSEGAYETIYLQPSIAQAGNITRLAFEKSDGTELQPLTGVIIYLKTTTATEFQNGTLDTLGYQRVYAGNFTNATAAGYQEVTLQRPFAYANTAGQNLAVLVLRRGGNVQATIGPRARYLYGVTMNPIRIACRRYTGTVPVTSATTLTATNILANIRLTFGTPQATQAARNTLALALFPNPASNILTLKLPTGRHTATVQVTDLLGRRVLPLTQLLPRPDGTVLLPIEILAAGQYLLRIEQGQAVAVQRFSKE